MPALDHMVETVKSGQFQWVAGGGQALSTCHVNNLCHALMLAADHGEDGAAYFVSDGVDTTLKAFLTRLLRAAASRRRTVTSFGLAWTMAGVMGFAWRLLRLKGEPPITRQMLRLIGKDFTLDISKARTELGYAPVLTPEDGFRMMANPVSRPGSTATASSHVHAG